MTLLYRQTGGYRASVEVVDSPARQRTLLARGCYGVDVSTLARELARTQSLSHVEASFLLRRNTVWHVWASGYGRGWAPRLAVCVVRWFVNGAESAEARLMLAPELFGDAPLGPDSPCGYSAMSNGSSLVCLGTAWDEFTKPDRRDLASLYWDTSFDIVAASRHDYESRRDILTLAGIHGREKTSLSLYLRRHVLRGVGGEYEYVGVTP